MNYQEKKYPYPTADGHYGKFGGKYIPETLVSAVKELERVYSEVENDPVFWKEFHFLLEKYAGRPTPLYKAEHLTEYAGGAAIYLKREDLCHTGAHKINNTIGQILLARRMGKKRIVAETGAGQHGVAAATVCALFGLPCIVYMGEEDIERQAPNVQRMKLLGAEVRPVNSGSRTLKDATSEAIRDWVTNVDSTFYIIGSVVGMHPYPKIVRDFQSVIGKETRTQFYEYENRLPDAIVACVGGGSNAMGIFFPFIDVADKIKLIGVEAAGEGLDSGKHAASLSRGTPGVLHGAFQYLLQDKNGQIQIAHSISAGLDYPGVGPEHSYWKDAGYAKYVSVTDREALEAFHLLARCEGIIPALESSHALAHAIVLAKKLGKNSSIIVNLSGRGDKDLATVLRMTQ